MRPRQQSLRIGAAACTVLIIWQVLPLPSSASQLQPDLNAELQAKTLAAALARRWPDASARSALARGLQTGPDGTLQPVRFARDGPLQCAAFLQCAACDAAGPELVALAQSRVFGPFVSELLSVLPRRARARVESGIHWSSPASLHMVVTGAPSARAAQQQWRGAPAHFAAWRRAQCSRSTRRCSTHPRVRGGAP